MGLSQHSIYIDAHTHKIMKVSEGQKDIHNLLYMHNHLAQLLVDS